MVHGRKTFRWNVVMEHNRNIVFVCENMSVVIFEILLWLFVELNCVDLNLVQKQKAQVSRWFLIELKQINFFTLWTCRILYFPSLCMLWSNVNEVIVQLLYLIDLHDWKRGLNEKGNVLIVVFCELLILISWLMKCFDGINVVLGTAQAY